MMKILNYEIDSGNKFLREQEKTMDYRKYVLAESVGYRITATARLVINRLNNNFKARNYPVTNEQWAIMIRLWEEDGLTQNKLSELTGKDQPSVSRLINNMEKNDLVTRMPHPVDKRTKLIFLTATGKKMQVGLIEQAQKTIEDISENIPDEDMKTFLSVLDQIDKNLRKEK
ncbi:MarR family winged helix-turn-helix transcriptional regulator [Evansella clarkii]|uniref:MarR family winged helix-turn-helix transcriptional regulator n=2 Tax=Evansella clarkii TaxID=79879 RepID=UPI001FD49AE7|nr:MarR family transcriptional regulator [Evansella clarkii]